MAAVAASNAWLLAFVVDKQGLILLLRRRLLLLLFLVMRLLHCRCQPTKIHLLNPMLMLLV